MSLPLPERASDTTAEQPWPVRKLSLKISDYVDKMVPLWVEGQIMQLNRRGATCYLTLRDPEADMSLSVTAPATTLAAMGPSIQEGTRVVVHAKPVFWTKRGSLMMDARQIRHVGIGELLARVEQLKQLLRSEGLFDAGRKRPLPFLPRRVGLITGRNSAAERDVVENARRRWPSVQFEIREVAVQGPTTVEEVSRALAELDALAEVEVIVVARGGGSVEDLLPFSNEAMVRAVSDARTPVVSAIGHDVDAPLLDFVADVRASTPTDAAKVVVPDIAAELQQIAAARGRAMQALRSRVRHERHRLEATRTRPAFADRSTFVTIRRGEVVELHRRGRAGAQLRLERADDRLGHLRAQLRALSPDATLRRGYAVVRHADGQVVFDRADVDPDETLRVTVAHGDFAVTPVS
ncbi:exodeoxyribonuclease VII large subunit [Barrientosiimonas humi]|uniref:exodeoxyribonuclease VII large subunit n=1 Tax=Barrientosiimonas humi TaxID=999931 RepID=UPI00370D0164